MNGRRITTDRSDVTKTFGRSNKSTDVNVVNVQLITAIIPLAIKRKYIYIYKYEEEDVTTARHETSFRRRSVRTCRKCRDFERSFRTHTLLRRRFSEAKRISKYSPFLPADSDGFSRRQNIFGRQMTLKMCEPVSPENRITIANVCFTNKLT